MCGDFVIPNPPWLVCKGSESRIFELLDLGAEGFELQVLDGQREILSARRFPSSELAIRWGFEERRLLQFDGWKHPYDQEVDEALEDGVRNWNLLAIGRRLRELPMGELLMNIPESRRAIESYAGAPYLGLLTTDDLFARFRMLTVASMDVDTDGKLAPAVEPEWHDKWTHALVEILRRDASLDDPRAKVDWGFLKTGSFQAAVTAYSRRTLDWGDDVLVKYGSIDFLRSSLKQGTFRISPASYYNDPSLNAARRDAELERVLVDRATDLTSLLGNMHDSMEPEHRALYTRAVRSATDYYILCLAGCWQQRLFGDFSANACLVITDPGRFIESLHDATKGLLPGWHFTCTPVRYIDPVQDLKFATTRTDMHFAPFVNKDFGYWYQKEVRAAWLPPDPDSPPTNLDHIFATLGNLEEYCEIIEL